MSVGGWHGSLMSSGGLTRTFGLQDQFSKAGQKGPAPKLEWRHLSRIGAYFKPYWREWMVILLCVAFSAALNMLPPFCIARIVDHAIPRRETGLLGLLAAAMVGLAVLNGLVGVLEQSLTARAGQNIMFDLRNELFRHLQTMSLHFYTTHRSGEIISRINNDVNAVQGVAARTIVAIVTHSLTLTAAVIALLWMNWRLAVLAILVMPVFYLPSVAVGRVRRKLAAKTQESQASLLTFMHERLHVGGALLTKVFGQAGADAAAFEAENAQIRDLNVRQTVVGRWLFVVLSVFSVVGPAVVYWYGGLEVMRGNLSLGQLVAFSALLAMLYRPLMNLATVYVDIQAAVAVFDRIFEYLDMRPQIVDGHQAKTLDHAPGRIQFQNVSFTYPTPAKSETVVNLETGEMAAPFALREVSFEVAPGQRVALVGPSGAGKTTVTNLLPRFFDPEAGRILLDGHDLRGLTQESLHRHIGIVTQETFLFHASIRENLLYAKPDATQAQLEAACQAANIHDFIATLPESYGTLVGERGYRLSGGEKQRLSIARALLKDPAILILDEATSSLDATSEYLIQQALEKLLKGRTSLIVAHRLATILTADQIIVLDRGRIVETGRHEELLDGGGLYAQLFRRQFSRVLESGSLK